MSGVKRGKPFIVPELELAPPIKTRFWSDEEKAVVNKYFGIRDVRSISAYLTKKYPPGRSVNAIRSQAYKRVME